MSGDINISHQGAIAVATVFALDWAKRSNLPGLGWINQNTEKLNRVISLAIALATSAGLKVMSGDAAHGWVVAIPPLSVILDTLVHAVTQFGGQEILHKLYGNHVIGKELLEKVSEIEKRLPTE